MRSPPAIALDEYDGGDNTYVREDEKVSPPGGATAPPVPSIANQRLLFGADASTSPGESVGGRPSSGAEATLVPDAVTIVAPFADARSAPAFSW